MLVLALALAACSEGSSGGGDAGDALPPIPNLSDTVAIGDIAIYQAVKAPIVAAGIRIDPPPIPIIADRPALVRVWPQLPDKYGKTLVGELHLFDVDGNPGKVLTEKKKLTQPPTEADRDGQLASSFNFNVPQDLFGADTQFRIVIRDPVYDATRPESHIQFPADGTTLDHFGGRTDSAELKVKILPIQYDFDGSHRLPATDAVSLQSFQDFLYRMYPVSKVTMTVHEPYAWSSALAPDGTGWDDLLLTVYAIRNMEKTPKDVYVVALFNPAPTWAAFCKNGCLGGIGFLNAATDPAMRIVEMVGYQEDYVFGTLDQELGHDMGRLHAPCGSPQQVDPSFPYKDGSIGKWGWDIVKSDVVDPTTNDFLSYCQPVFVSDYTYKGLYDQMALVTSTLGTKSVSPPKKWQVAIVDPNGNLSWSTTPPIEWSGPVMATRRVRLNGAAIDTPYWDLPKLHRGFVLVPEEKARGARLAW